MSSLQEKWTPLMAAAHNGHADIVDVLLQKNADPDKQDNVCIIFHS